jgi:DNA-binding GntR family transcriptional regulator
VAQASKNATAMLRDLILAGALAAGSKLGEAELATRLDVSRTPVREALSRLAAEGLVEIVPNRGARVARWTDEDLAQIFELRLRLEPYAVGLAVPRLSDNDLDELDDLALRMQNLGKPGRTQDLDGIVQLNRQFHRTLINRAANPALASSLLAVTHASVVNQNFHNYSPAALARSLSHHVEIVAAARAGNAEWANSVMRSHLYNARATMLPAANARPEVT